MSWKGRTFTILVSLALLTGHAQAHECECKCECKDNSVKQSDNIYNVTVDYSQSITEMVRAGKYEYASSNISDKNFKKKQTSGQVSVNLKLINLNKAAGTDEVLRELDSRGLRPATLEELFALGSTYPEEQRKYPIVALGSRWQYWNGRWSVPYLWGDASERYLRLHWVESGWSSYYRFAAVCK